MNAAGSAPTGGIPPIPYEETEGETRLTTEPGTSAGGTGPSGITRAGPTTSRSVSPLQAGENFGTRYHIIRTLGVGGMGAVYQAWDQELEVAVAVKVVRPDVAEDPALAQDLERRFKRELLLARQVTHKNVVRIHDIGEIDGIKYITMPYVHGSDLASILRSERRLPVARALEITIQIVEGLAAAHEAGVVHRDLKPANIMVNDDGHALIMDFGIARSSATTTGFAMTVAGAVIGTVEYMAPEQAKAEPVDHRADIYAFGLILYDMLRGNRHAGSTTAVAELMSRMQHPPPALHSQDPQIPEDLDALVTRCLQPNPADRYQSTADLLRDLRSVAGGGAVTSLPFSLRWRRTLARRGPLNPALGVAGLLLVVGLIGAAVRFRSGASEGAPSAASPAGPVMSLAVVPFRNASGDPALDSLGASLSEVLATDLGQAAHVRTVPSERVQKVLGDLRIDPNSNLSPHELNRIADFASAQSILWGQYIKFGNEIRIDATLQDLEQQRTIPLRAAAANQSSLLTAVAELTASVQQTLAAGSADVLKELQASAWRPSTQSFEALQSYNEGLRFSRNGDHQGALKRYQAAVQQDPDFALAYSAMAQTYATLGYDAEAGQQSRRALALSQSLPVQERYLIAGVHHRLANDVDKAIETYVKLLEVSPNNVQIQFELGTLYEGTGALEQAQQHYEKTVSLDPKHIEGLTAVGRVAIKRGDPQASIQPLTNAQALTVQLNNDEARANVLQALGVAYKRMGRRADALKHYQESLEIKRRTGQKRGMAVSLGEIAQVQELDGKPQEAVKSYNEALALQREIGDKSGIGLTLINLAALLNDTLGRPDDALPLLREALTIERDVGNRVLEALALNNIGTAYLAKGQFSDAQTYFERALELREKTNVPREIADTLHNLAETLTKMGRYDQALTRYLRALELRRKDGDTRNEAIESYSIGTIFDYQGRYGAAVESKGAALAAFRSIEQKDFWFGEILSGYGGSLTLSGRLDEAAAALDEALAAAKGLNHAGLIAQVLRLQAERLHARGDVKAAMKTAADAAQAASRAADRAAELWTRAEVARAGAAAQASRSAAAALRDLAAEAERHGHMYLAVYAAVHGAEALLQSGAHQQAQREAERALARADSLGARELAARSEYVIGSAMRRAGGAQARRHYANAQQILDDMKREEGNQKLLDRADLAAIYAECVKWSQAAA